LSEDRSEVIALARLARAARQAQQAYFDRRSNANLEAAKAAEHKLDVAVRAILDPPTLFGDPDESEARS
jgi:hypothetical protein